MKLIITLFILGFTVLTSYSALAEPIVTRNVVVQHQASLSQCTSSWRGSAGSVIDTSVSSIGQNNSFAGASVQSCTGCSLQGSDCVCTTCYQYNN